LTTRTAADLETLQELKAAGLTVLLVEQNAVEALGVSDRGFALQLGHNRFTGRGAALLADERARRLSLGGPSRRGRRSSRH
jgi:branched-chain amino acid transport system ATP-binding protein